MEQLDFKPPTVKPKDWDMIINPLMKNHEPVEPPEGVTTHDQLRNHLEEFCLNRHIGSDINDLKKGRCQGQVYLQDSLVLKESRQED